VEFGLRFETQEDTEDKPDILTEVKDAVAEEAPMQEMVEEAPEAEEPVRKEAEVVSLDQFRKS